MGGSLVGGEVQEAPGAGLNAEKKLEGWLSLVFWFLVFRGN